MKIKSKNEQFWGGLMNVPVDGEITIGKDGLVEVSDEAAELLLTSESDWHDPSVKAEVAKVEKSEEVNELETELAKLDLAGLIKFAKEDLEIPEAEFAKYAKVKKLMISFIVKKQAQLVADSIEQAAADAEKASTEE